MKQYLLQLLTFLSLSTLFLEQFAAQRGVTLAFDDQAGNQKSYTFPPDMLFDEVLDKIAVDNNASPGDLETTLRKNPSRTMKEAKVATNRSRPLLGKGGRKFVFGIGLSPAEPATGHVITETPTTRPAPTTHREETKRKVDIATTSTTTPISTTPITTTITPPSTSGISATAPTSVISEVDDLRNKLKYCTEELKQSRNLVESLLNPTS